MEDPVEENKEEVNRSSEAHSSDNDYEQAFRGSKRQSRYNWNTQMK